MKDAIPSLARKYLTKATNEMKLGDELRQYVQVALDRIIENSFPDILRDASEGFRAQEIADRNAAPSHDGLPLASDSSSKPSPITRCLDNRHPSMSLNSEPTLDGSGTEMNILSTPPISEGAKTRSTSQIDDHQDHYLDPSMTLSAYSSFGAGIDRENQELQKPDAAQSPLDIRTQMQTSMFESQTGWQEASLGDTNYDWQGVEFGSDLDFEAEHTVSDDWD